MSSEIIGYLNVPAHRQKKHGKTLEVFAQHGKTDSQIPRTWVRIPYTELFSVPENHDNAALLRMAANKMNIMECSAVRNKFGGDAEHVGPQYTVVV